MKVYNTPIIYKTAILKALTATLAKNNISTPEVILDSLELSSGLESHNNQFRYFEYLLSHDIKVADLINQLLAEFNSQPLYIHKIEFDGKFGFLFAYNKNILK